MSRDNLSGHREVAQQEGVIDLPTAEEAKRSFTDREARRKGIGWYACMWMASANEKARDFHIFGDNALRLFPKSSHNDVVDAYAGATTWLREVVLEGPDQ